MVIGNTGAGKSSFVNYLLGQPLQKTGSAPLDDCFTIISHAETPADKDGPAIVGNRNLPYASLANVEGNFMAHLRMKMLPHKVRHPCKL